MHITENSFETYEILILSGQVPDDDIQALLRENPDFAKWYRARALQAAGTRPGRSMPKSSR